MVTILGYTTDHWLPVGFHAADCNFLSLTVQLIFRPAHSPLI